MHRKKGKDELVTDPVCGMTKPRREMKAQMEYQGKIYYFCYEGDKQMFAAYPQHWVAKLNKKI